MLGCDQPVCPLDIFFSNRRTGGPPARSPHVSDGQLCFACGGGGGWVMGGWRYSTSTGSVGAQNAPVQGTFAWVCPGWSREPGILSAYITKKFFYYMHAIKFIGVSHTQKEGDQTQSSKANVPFCFCSFICTFFYLRFYVYFCVCFLYFFVG